MIRNIGKLFLTLCLLMVGGGVVANAQVDAVPQKIEVNIPFAFAVGDTKLPAGRYEIRIPEPVSPNVLEIRDARGHTSVVFNTESAEKTQDEIANKTELIFDKIADQYFLSQIWVAGSTSGNELPKSRMEKRLSNGGNQPEKHSVVAFMRHLKP